MKLIETNHYDVIIVGARCAGAATAMRLAQQGARVLVVDHARYGSDTMSTHALMRGAVFKLRQWGLLDKVAKQAPAIRRTSFIYSGECHDVDIKPEKGVDALYAPRRWMLDSMLAMAAAQAGAEFRFETGCRGLVFGDDGRVRGVHLRNQGGETETIYAPLVIGADGRRSIVAREVGAQVNHQAEHSSACVYQYVTGITDRGYRWHFDKYASGGIIPTNDGQSCVFVAGDPGTMAGERDAYLKDIAKRAVPAMAEEIAGAKPIDPKVMFSGQLGYLKQSNGPGWALVGDAGYFRDPLTAHGISDAFRDADLLASCVINGGLDKYTSVRDRLSADIFMLSDRIAAHDWTIPELQNLHKALNIAMKVNMQEMESSEALRLAA